MKKALCAVVTLFLVWRTARRRAVLCVRAIPLPGLGGILAGACAKAWPESLSSNPLVSQKCLVFPGKIRGAQMANSCSVARLRD